MMKQLWINGEPMLDDENNPVPVERIEFNDDEIIGYIGRSEVFALRGLHPDRNTYEVKDEKDEQVTPDKSELVQLKQRVDTLETASGVDIEKS